MLYNVLLIMLIVVSVAMIVLILMQQGKGADAGAAFGSGASGTVFGSQGSANFLSRTTAILATLFFLLALALAFLASGRTIQSGSIMEAVTPSGQAVETAAPVPNSDVPPAPAAEKASSDVPPAVDAKPSDKVEEKAVVDEKKPIADEKPVQESK
ncbi:preprotein translocase subunit SecG [Candidatus Thiothrix anitrata]|uniref:Protein-export membrane protein SecG n=1 Tax=Candidatus Thiothrix anitrata TaxID=2823902 RepID=A0ABX7WZ58_9GAMM|nr:preprotein translocase subunit SecG [Candidatus Thiothrix anitrata]QTR48631.1 preprotein translocase subunit SecG [Candidatus Thiothrix anitrata]